MKQRNIDREKLIKLVYENWVKKINGFIENQGEILAAERAVVWMWVEIAKDQLGITKETKSGEALSKAIEHVHDEDSYALAFLKEMVRVDKAQETQNIFLIGSINTVVSWVGDNNLEMPDGFDQADPFQWMYELYTGVLSFTEDQR